MADNKKDSFTFSDKIKNSKPAFSPFSKRGASKIGNNGKPKKTLFERTRRDAPFMAAAAAALLLLPFLYKYSGNVEDGAGSKIITPGIGDEFIPERFDFDPTGDGNLSQLSGRDPLSLIKGWGEPEEQPNMREGLDDLMPPQTRAAQAPVYQSPYRPQVAPQVRASVARTPTKINEMRGAGLNFHGGGGIGSRFGGAELRQAARAHSGPGPNRSTKPVSLQPLRAAGTPSRAYYGNQSLARARQSRDAMSKADAPTALKDALFTAAPARGLRGLGEASAAAGGPGGPGGIERTMDFKGMKPWWWDMMQNRSQQKWEWEYFLWRRNLIEPLIKGLAESFVKFMDVSLSCLLTATDDYSVGKMGRTKGVKPTKDTCNIDAVKYECQQIVDKKIKDYETIATCDPDDDSYKFKDWCNNHDHGWNPGKSAEAAMSYVGRVRHCFNESYTGKDGYQEIGGLKPYDVRDQFLCKEIRSEQHLFKLEQGMALTDKKQKPFHIVLAENTVNSEGTPLCGNALHRDHQTSRTSGQGNRDKGQSKCLKWEHYTENGSFYGKCLEYESPRAVGQKSRTKYKDYKDEAIIEYQDGAFALEDPHHGGRFMDDPKYMDACVVYLAWGDPGHRDAGDSFSYARYKGEVEQWLQSSGKRNWNVADVHPVAIVGFSAKEKASSLKKYVGYTYKDFLMGVNEKMGAGLAATYCDWGAFNITASEITNPFDLYSKLFYAKDIPLKDMNVTLEIKDGAKTILQNLPAVCEEQNVGKEDSKWAWCSYKVTDENSQRLITNALQGENGRIVAVWTAKYKEDASSDQAEYKGNPPSLEPNQDNCDDGQEQYVILSFVNGALQSTVQTDAPDAATACYLKQTCTDKKWTPDTNGANFTGKCDNGSGQSIKGLTFAHDMLQIQANPNSGHQSFKLDSNGQVTYQPATGSRRYQQGSFKSNDLARFNSAVLRESESADKFMTGIASKYNAKHNDPKDAKLVHLSGNSPKLSEFVDALITAGDVGVTDVEKSAVCEMARSIAKVSVDEQVPGVNVSTIGSLQLSNVFGTFAVYLGPEAVYFPAYKVKVGNNPERVDLRFAENPYMAGNYIDPKWGGASATSKQEIAATGFPLEELRDGFNIPTTVSTQAQLDANRRAYRGEYSQIFFADNGQCAKLAGTMPIAKVLQYMDKVKDLSLSYKPKAAVSSGNNNFSSSSTVNGSRTGAHR